MCKINHITVLFAGIITLLFVSGCTKDDILPVPEETLSVRFDISNEKEIFTKAPSDAALSVNRILILPFRKINESDTNDPANFVPVYSAAKQLDVNSFPAISTKLNLVSGSTYQIMAIGYNRTDFDFANQSAPFSRFNLGPASGATLNSFYLQPVNANVVPEFYTCMGSGYMNETLIGGVFKPEQVNNIRGNLVRLVSGFTLDISSIPGYVTSMTLVAEKLVTTSKATDGTPLLWQNAGDSGVKTLGTKTPVSGKVTFDTFLLPTLAARQTLFYLDVAYGSSTERYTMKIIDTPNVVSGNRITFTPNHWVKVTGDYTLINLGFILADDINLDDNNWDGIQ